ncbi:MAG: class A beta-lactamase-related serine hydrolase, partial [Gemmatales bacterium]|nr:class A beta-lactamase-related serine hydrolase [Gemmatales bacterium]MDW8385405.1 serine hydrolase [Gemmatales bacterium]
MVWTRSCVSVVGCLLLSLIGEAVQTGNSDGEQEIRAVGRELLASFSAEPRNLERLFASGFFKELEARRLNLGEVFRALHAQHGKAVEFRVLGLTGPYTAEVEFVFANGVRKPARLALDVRPPHPIVGLEFRADIRSDDSFESVTKDLAKLPGKAGFCLKQLTPETMVLAAHQADEPFAVASSMKLIILAVLADDVAAKKRTWSEVVPVRRSWASLPAGLVQDWPEGSPVTLHTLATLMISRSDNTAADHLIRVLGRERIEHGQVTLGLRYSNRNRPFLLTSEMFKLKLVMQPSEQEEFIQADVEARRKLLDGPIADTSLARPRGLGPPQHIDTIEWFYSPTDMVLVLDHLRKHPVANDVLPLLAIHRGLSVDDLRWNYVG